MAIVMAKITKMLTLKRCNKTCSSEDEDESEPETKEKSDDDEEAEPRDWGRCTVHLTRDDLPKMRKTTPMNTAGNFLKFMFRFKQAMKFPGTKWFVPAWGAVARSYL